MAEPKAPMAPDGGPVSPKGLNLKSRVYDLVPVIVKSTGGQALIRKEQFDPEVYDWPPTKRIKVEKKIERPSGDMPKGVVEFDTEKFGTESGDELSLFTVGALKDLEEWKAIAPKPTKKGAIVAAILAVRAKFNEEE